MRLNRVTLDRYGAFTDLSVRFGPGLTVIHGRNEAGKSTLTHAIGDVLWGLVARQHRYAFEVAPSRLQVTADVEGATGPQTLVVTGRGCRDAAGTPVERWWADGVVVSRQAWEVGFGIDRDRLRDGGRAVLQDGGDLVDLLFRARTGVDLAAARDRMLAEADGIWRRHRNARTVLLRTTRQTADDLRDRVAEAVHAADAVALVAEQLRHADAELGAARAAHAGRVAAAQGAQRDARAHPPAVALAAVRGEIDELLAAGEVLRAEALARHDEIADELADAERACHDLAASLAELDALPLPAPDREALAVADLVDELRRGEEAEATRCEQLQAFGDRARRLGRDLRQAATDLDPTLALADEATLRRAAPALILPVETVDLLDRLADQVDDARRLAEEAARQVRSAQSELAPAEAAGPGAARSRWDAARDIRDRTWERIREPWLAGTLPEPSARAALAADLDDALAATDVAAGQAAAEVEQHVEAQTRAQERQRRLDIARGEHAAVADAHAGLVEQWQLALRSCGLPDALDVPAWRVRCQAAHRLSAVLADLSTIASDRDELAAASLTFHQRVAGAVGGLGIDTEDPLAALATAHRRVVAARQARTATAEREHQRSLLAAKLANAEARQQQAARTLTELAAQAPGGDLGALVERSRRLLALRGREQVVVDQLRAAAPDDDPDVLVGRLSRCTVEEVAQAVGLAEDQLADAADGLELARERRTALAAELRAAQQDRDAAALHQQQVDALDHMAELARRWVRLRLMAGLLDRVLHTDDSQADATLLQHAGSLAGVLTGGRVQGLGVDDDPGRPRRLVVNLSGDLDADAAGLSEGTADQVFLALRLAGIRQRHQAARAIGADSLPVVLDDVLMAHDDQRTEAALHLLVEESRDQQIIVFTHHRSVAELARAAGATVADLGSRCDLDPPSPVGGTEVPGAPEVDPARAVSAAPR